MMQSPLKEDINTPHHMEAQELQNAGSRSALSRIYHRDYLAAMLHKFWRHHSSFVVCETKCILYVLNEYLCSNKAMRFMDNSDYIRVMVDPMSKS